MGTKERANESLKKAVKSHMDDYDRQLREVETAKLLQRVEDITLFFYMFSTDLDMPEIAKSECLLQVLTNQLGINSNISSILFKVLHDDDYLFDTVHIAKWLYQQGIRA